MEFTKTSLKATAEMRLLLLQELVAQGVLTSASATDERRPMYYVERPTAAGRLTLTLTGDAVDYFVHGARAVQEQATPSHDCGLCDGRLVFAGMSEGHRTWVCTACDWWHTSQDCCDTSAVTR